MCRRTSLDVLDELASDKDEYVRRAVADNSSTSPSTLRILSNDPFDLVRRAVAENDSTPVDVLEELTRDSSSSVRQSAKKHLKDRTKEETIEHSSKPKRLSWPKLISQLRSEAEDGIDSLYEQTSAGSELESICSGVEGKIGIWLEPSIQGGQGGIWFYSSEDDSTLASDYDYQTYNENVLSLALQSKNVTEFRNKYRSFVQSILDDPAYAPEADE